MLLLQNENPIRIFRLAVLVTIELVPQLDRMFSEPFQLSVQLGNSSVLHGFYVFLLHFWFYFVHLLHQKLKVLLVGMHEFQILSLQLLLIQVVQTVQLLEHAGEHHVHLLVLFLNVLFAIFIFIHRVQSPARLAQLNTSLGVQSLLRCLVRKLLRLVVGSVIVNCLLLAFAIIIFLHYYS